MELEYRESTEGWAQVLRSLRERGMSAPLLAVGDGALDRVYPTTAHQRCRKHRALNVQTQASEGSAFRGQTQAERDVMRAESD